MQYYKASIKSKLNSFNSCKIWKIAYNLIKDQEVYLIAYFFRYITCRKWFSSDRRFLSGAALKVNK